MMMEEMGAFFDARADGYEDHMRANVGGAGEFYAVTARALPRMPELRLLDLGCGTGLELDELFPLQPDARVTGVDLSDKMLEKLGEKHAGRTLTLIRGSYFDVPFPGPFDAAVSVETMHHFSAEDKLRLYQKILGALAPGGVYVETDFVASDDATESAYLTAFSALLPGEAPGHFHIDIPMTIPHQIALLEGAGFAGVECIWQKFNTAVLRAFKR